MTLLMTGSPALMFTRSLLTTALAIALSGSSWAAQKLEVNTLMKNKISSFSESQMTVKAGDDIEITVQNSSTDPKEYRNWVLVTPGSESAVMTSAMNAGAEKQWAPSGGQIIAQSKLIPPGDSEVVRFKAPSSPGEYPYFCTFPGHFMTMKGKLVVRAAGKGGK